MGQGTNGHLNEWTSRDKVPLTTLKRYGFISILLLVPAALDKKPDLMDPKDLQALSTKSNTRKHPGVMLLFPNRKPADAPAVEAKPKEHWVLSFREPVTAEGQKTALGFSLVVVGQTMAE